MTYKERPVGSVNVEITGLFARITAAVYIKSDELFRAYLFQGENSVLIGIAEPCGDCLKCVKKISLRQLKESGIEADGGSIFGKLERCRGVGAQEQTEACVGGRSEPLESGRKRRERAINYPIDAKNGAEEGQNACRGEYSARDGADRLKYPGWSAWHDERGISERNGFLKDGPIFEKNENGRLLIAAPIEDKRPYALFTAFSICTPLATAAGTLGVIAVGSDGNLEYYE